MSRFQLVYASFGVMASALVIAAFIGSVGMAQQEEERVVDSSPAIPIDGPYLYKVEYLGITCGYMTLESRQELYRGKPAFHIVMTVWNSKFFNKIYKVDGQIDSWIDAETMTSLVYASEITEKGKLKVKRYHIDLEKGVVKAQKRGKTKTAPFDGMPALDPMAFVFRSRLLAGEVGTTFTLRLLTDYGSYETVSEVGGLKRFQTSEGKKELLRVQPITADGEMFSHKGEFVMWIDPKSPKTLHRLVFKLGFGQLVAKLVGPVPTSDK